MKRIALIAVMVLMSLGASARSIHYFTYSQAARTVHYLNSQNELMIYCGYEYELETYVLINEIWMERINSSYYEIWIYGYDAYTGDEIYMPLDLQCVWLFSAGRMYNAAQYLRFRIDVRTPSIVWHIPAYRPFTRIVHRPGYVRSYHYDIHRHGWMPPAYTYTPAHPVPPLPYYYMRHPSNPAPMPKATWTPGSERPTVTAPHVSSTRNATTAPTVNSGSRNTTSPSTRNASNTSTTPSRNTTTTSTPTRNTTNTTTPTRNTANTSTAPTRSTTSTSTATRNTNATAPSTPTRSATTTTATPAPSRNATSTSTTTRNTANRNSTKRR